MARLLAVTFARHDPPAVALGLTAEEFEAFVTVVCRSAGVERLTISARDVASGEMVAALLAEDGATSPPAGMDDLSPRFEPIFELFGQLDEQTPSPHPTAPGEVVHLFLLGVDATFMGRGIAHRLVATCVANASACGYRTAVTEATNGVSQHIFAKLGFVGRAQGSYADYRRDGVALFASIAGHGGPMAMSRDITDVR